MHTTSRDAFGRASEQLDSVVRESDAATLRTVGDELLSVANALADHLDLRRHLVDPAVSEDGRVQVLQGVLRDKVGGSTLDVLTTLVRSRVSTSTDLVEAVEELGRDALLSSAEKADTLSEVEDELFRFGRLLDREQRLLELLTNTTEPASGRVGLLDQVLSDRVDPITHRLLAQAVARPQARPLDRTAEVLAEAAAARRDRSIARVVSPVVLGERQESRLAESLSSLYGRRISVHVDVDPEILGGLVVRVGGEVIDGSVLGRLRSAATARPN
ncbi:F0F1 ATP synthase subunit delta [Actinomycetospora sp. C-140]